MAKTTIYLIDSTDGGTTFAIQPRTFDGIGGVQSTTDLTLYGNDAERWGERFNENFYQLLENFAIEQNTIFSSIVDVPPTPHDITSASQGGNGINNPIVGQHWFNKSDNKMYVYTVDGWKGTGSASTTKSPNPSSGDLWLNGSTTTLNYYNGSAWVAVSSVTGGNFVSTTGDTMSGTLTIANPSAETQLLIHRETSPLIYLKTDATAYQTSSPPMIISYNPDNDPAINLGAGGADKPYMKLTHRDGHYFSLEAGLVYGSQVDLEVLTAEQSSNELIYHLGEVLLPGSVVTNITNPKHVATKEYVDSLNAGGSFVDIAGDLMTGSLEFDVSQHALSIIFDPFGNPSKGGPISISSTSGGLLQITTDNNITGYQQAITISPYAPHVHFGVDVIFGSLATFDSDAIFNGDVNMGVGVDLILDHDPVAPLEAATKQYVDTVSGLPVATVIQSAVDVTPVGTLRCNGSAVSRTTYAALFAEIGTFHGSGNGSTTFNLPDWRGEFLRCWDDGRGIDVGRTIASTQSGDIEAHIHEAQSGSGSVPKYPLTAFGSGFEGGVVTPTDWQLYNTGSTGGTETRPRNVALLTCIAY